MTTRKNMINSRIPQPQIIKDELEKIFTEIEKARTNGEPSVQYEVKIERKYIPVIVHELEKEGYDETQPSGTNTVVIKGILKD